MSRPSLTIECLALLKRCRAWMDDRREPAELVQEILDVDRLLAAPSGRVEFCAWCPNPERPSPVHHPDGGPEHRTADPVAVEGDPASWIAAAQRGVWASLRVAGVEVRRHAGAVIYYDEKTGRVLAEHERGQLTWREGAPGSRQQDALIRAHAALYAVAV
jgi:hypothetical protein